jgi:hypothetical protein
MMLYLGRNMLSGITKTFLCLTVTHPFLLLP